MKIASFEKHSLQGLGVYFGPHMFMLINYEGPTTLLTVLLEPSSCPFGQH